MLESAEALLAEHAELEAQLKRQEVATRELREKLARQAEEAGSAGVAGDALEPVLAQAIADLRQYIQGGLPFKTDERLASGQVTPTSLVLDGDWLYWVSPAGMHRVSRFGGAPTLLAPGPVGVLTVDATHVYFLDMEGLKRVAK